MSNDVPIEGLISRTQLRLSKIQLRISLSRLANAKKKGNKKRIARWEKKVNKWIGKVTKWAEKDDKDPDTELNSVKGYTEYKAGESSIAYKIGYPSLAEFDDRSDIDHIHEMINWIKEEDLEDGVKSLHDMTDLVMCQSQIMISSSLSEIGIPMTEERAMWGSSRRTQVQKSAEQEASTLLVQSGNDHDSAIKSAQKILVDAVQDDSLQDAEFMAYVIQYLQVLKSEKDIPGGWVRGNMNEIEAFINEVAFEEGSDAAIGAAYELRSQVDQYHDHYAQLGDVISKAETDDALIGILLGRGIIGNKRLMRRLKKVLDDGQYAAVENITEEDKLVDYLMEIKPNLNSVDERKLDVIVGDILRRMKRNSRRGAAAMRRTTRLEQFRQFREKGRARARTKQGTVFSRGSGLPQETQGGASDLSDVTLAEPIVPPEIASLLESVHDCETVAEAIKPVCDHYKSCEGCGEECKRKCKGCSTVYYCGSECSNNDWKFHKAECKAIQTKAKWSELEGTEHMDAENPQSILMRQLTRHSLDVEFELEDIPEANIGDEIPELEDFTVDDEVPELEYVGKGVTDFEEDPELEYIGQRGGRGGRRGGGGRSLGRAGRLGRTRGGRRFLPGYGRRYFRYGPRRFRRGRFDRFGRGGYYGRGYGFRWRPWAMIAPLALAGLAAGIAGVNPYYYYYYPQYRAAVLNRYPGYMLPSSFVAPGYGAPYSGWTAPPGYGGFY